MLGADELALLGLIIVAMLAFLNGLYVARFLSRRSADVVRNVNAETATPPAPPAPTPPSATKAPRAPHLEEQPEEQPEERPEVTAEVQAEPRQLASPGNVFTFGAGIPAWAMHEVDTALGLFEGQSDKDDDEDDDEFDTSAEVRLEREGRIQYLAAHVRELEAQLARKNTDVRNLTARIAVLEPLADQLRVRDERMMDRDAVNQLQVAERDALLRRFEGRVADLERELSTRIHFSDTMPYPGLPETRVEPQDSSDRSLDEDDFDCLERTISELERAVRMSVAESAGA